MIAHVGPWSALVTLKGVSGAEAVAGVLALERHLLGAGLELTETVPAFNRLLVTGRRASWDPDRFEALVREVVPGILSGDLVLPRSRHEVVLPACYHESLGPDLSVIADRAGLTRTDAAKLHADGRYTVLATGFSPGFAYLGDLAQPLAMPRRDTPRQIHAGSIGIADRRTAVYPSDGPGGWQIVGAVPRSLFESATERLGRFAPGHPVRFRRITLTDYERES